MKSTSLAVVTSLLSSASLSSSLSIVKPGILDVLVTLADPMTFRVSQVHNENFVQYGRGPRAVAKAYQKYGVTMPEDLVTVLQSMLTKLGGNAGPSSSSDVLAAAHSNTSSTQGEVSAIPQLFDSEYLTAVQIGTPPQTVNLQFDTGSSDLWVFSSETPASEKSGQEVYNVLASSTAKKLQEAIWYTSYGDGSASSGNVYTDVVSVGGVTVANQAVETASQVSDSFTQDTASSGIMGLAFSRLNQVRPEKQKTFFEQAMSSLAMPVFTANLNKGKAGNFNFGFIDKTEFEGPLSYVDLNTTTGFWQFETSGYSVGKQSIVGASHQAIADTGTTLILLPPALVGAYYAQVPSAQNSPSYGGYVFACDTALPSITLRIGEYQAVVPSSVLNFSPADTDSFATAKTCFGGIQSNQGLSYAIYGDIFFKSQFVVFDGGIKQIGFASKPVA